MSKDNLFPPAAPDFSDPLGLLRACHERIFKHCDTLEKLASHVSNHGVDNEAREAASQVHRYFSTAAKHHHQDEEQDLFPHLARQSLKLADLVHSLRQDHEKIESLWAEIEPFLANPATIENSEEFPSLATRFADAYRQHAKRENSELLEMAQHIFGREELMNIGRAMAERRGVKQPL